MPGPLPVLHLTITAMILSNTVRTNMSQQTSPISGNLTTPWTTAPTCFSANAPLPVSSTVWNIADQVMTCVHGQPWPTEYSDCWPPRTANAPAAPMSHSLFSGWGFYSPGTRCPSGFTSACIATFGQLPANRLHQFPLGTGETAVGCCPRCGFSPDYMSSEEERVLTT